MTRRAHRDRRGSPRPERSTSIVLVKLGGSLLTDKRRDRGARKATIDRITAEIVRAAESLGGGILLGHGSGSFGHRAAARHGLGAGPVEPAAVAPGVAATQEAAAELHRRVVAALRRAGGHPFSFAPASALVSRSGRPSAPDVRPLLLALAGGLLPVTYGDVLLDTTWGASICSTERLFLSLVPRLRRAGARIERAYWLGETEGVYDEGGRTIPRLSVEEARSRLASIGDPRGTDVTGGMRHRLEAVIALAERGVTSWILDGRVAGRLEKALTGAAVPGTTIGGARAAPRDRGERGEWAR